MKGVDLGEGDWRPASVEPHPLLEGRKGKGSDPNPTPSLTVGRGNLPTPRP